MAAGAIPVGTAGTVALVAVALVALLGWIALRPGAAAQGRRRARDASQGEGAGAALLVTWCAVAAVLWVRNPYAAALLVPGAHALLAVVAPEVRLRRGLAVALVVVAAAPFLLVDLSIAGQLGLSPADFGWFCVLLVAGGVVGPLGWVIWSLVLACLVAALLVALRSRASVAAQETAADHRARPGQLRGPGLAGRHRVRAAAMRRALGTALVVAGLLVLADAAATLAWQEPLSALRAGARPAPPRRAAAGARAGRAAAARRRPRPASPRPRARSRARAATARRSPSCASRASACATIVVRGTSPADLREGPGLIAGTPLPGQRGTTAIAGHRTTYGAPFRHLDALRRGDAITLRLPYGSFRYAVEGRRIVAARRPIRAAPRRP